MNKQQASTEVIERVDNLLWQILHNNTDLPNTRPTRLLLAIGLVEYIDDPKAKEVLRQTAAKHVNALLRNVDIDAALNALTKGDHPSHTET